MDNNFRPALLAFVAALQARIVSETHTRFPSLSPDTVVVDMGSKYAKVISQRDGGGRSVHSFVRIADGAILYAASWKAPAKHVRGSIHTPDCGMSAVGVYGANSLR